MIKRLSPPSLIGILTAVMFFTFALTTDAVGFVIPEIIKTFGLSQSEAASFHYATMIGIAGAGLFLGGLADRFGFKAAIVGGLGLYATACLLMVVTHHYTAFLLLLFLSGAAIGVFKTGALRLISETETDADAHTRTMNRVEAFFALGAMVGPVVVAALLSHRLSWAWLYALAGALCLILLLLTLQIKVSKPAKSETPKSTMALKAVITDPMALFFSGLIMLYVSTEASVMVWMPTLLESQNHSVATASLAMTVFFGLRAAGRFLGAWVLARVRWQVLTLVCASAILLCFGLSILNPKGFALFALPLSGLFMAVLYPTFNSRGMGCFPKDAHGTVSGVILFFTCLSAGLTPFLMGLISDKMGGSVYGFALVCGLCALMVGLLVYNLRVDPSKERMKSYN